MKILVITSHPYPDQSNVILKLQASTESKTGITVRNLESIYGNNVSGFDIAAEQKAAENAHRIVFLFPIHWFNLTPMLKAYMNEVWTYGWAFGPNGDALKGKELQVVVTAGATAHTYSHDGLIQSTIEEVLTPLKASALYVGLKYLPPLAFYSAKEPSDESLNSIRQTFEDRVLS